MDEGRINELMSNLDNDLLLQELDVIMADIDIDVDSIAQKAHWKLRKEKRKMNKHKKNRVAIIAASLVLVCGAMSVYASEISVFIQSLTGKTGVYGTVVDGQAYYLAESVALDNGNRLSAAMFDKNELQIQIQMADGSRPDVKIRIDGVEMEPRGMEGSNLSFYDLKPTSQFDLILNGKSYPIQLTAGKSVVDGGEIFEVKSEAVPWISMGYKKIEGGIQLLATMDDPSITVGFFKSPGKDTIKQTTNNKGVSNSSREGFLPILGYDQDGKSYEFHEDSRDMGRPLTKFTSDAPAGKKLTIKLPGIVVQKEKSLDLKVAIPAENKKQDILQTIDLGLQKMRLESIERTSDTTARLRFTLNTGEQKNIRIWETYLDSMTAESTASLWENGVCVMDVTFASGTNELKLYIANPSFIVDGNWAFNIQ